MVAHHPLDVRARTSAPAPQRSLQLPPCAPRPGCLRPPTSPDDPSNTASHWLPPRFALRGVPPSTQKSPHQSTPLIPLPPAAGHRRVAFPPPTSGGGPCHTALPGYRLPHLTPSTGTGPERRPRTQKLWKKPSSDQSQSHFSVTTIFLLKIAPRSSLRSGSARQRRWVIFRTRGAGTFNGRRSGYMNVTHQQRQLLEPTLACGRLLHVSRKYPFLFYKRAIMYGLGIACPLSTRLPSLYPKQPRRLTATPRTQL